MSRTLDRTLRGGGGESKRKSGGVSVSYGHIFSLFDLIAQLVEQWFGYVVPVRYWFDPVW